MSEVIVSLLSAFVGGGFVAILNYYLNREHMRVQTEAARTEIQKNKVDIDRIRAVTETARTETERNKAELSRLNDQQSKQESEIEDLKLLFTTVLTEWERDHLKKLNSQNKFSYRWSDDFKRDLSRLLALSFIERRPDKGIRTAKADTRTDNDLREHFSITTKGKQYLGRLDALEQALRDLEA